MNSTTCDEKSRSEDIFAQARDQALDLWSNAGSDALESREIADV